MIAHPLAIAAVAAALALPIPASATDYPTTAIVVSPIGEARVVLADDGMDHVEYDLLVTNIFDKPVALTRLEVLDPGGTVLMTVEGEALEATTQTLLTGEPLSAVPASGAAALEVDLILAPGTAPAEVTHRLAYTIPADSPFAAIVGTLTIDGPVVTVDRTPPTRIIAPVTGEGWSAMNGCCAPDVHRNVRIGAGTRIARPELFSIDWLQLDGTQVFSGDGKSNADYAFFGHPIRAVANGTVVDRRDGMEESIPFSPVTTVRTPQEYGGNYIVLQIAPTVYAFYAHLQQGSVKVEVGDVVEAGAVIANLGNSGNSSAPHLHFGLIDNPIFHIGEGLPFVIDEFTVTGVITGGDGSRAEITPQNRNVKNAYPLAPGIATYK